MSWMPYVQLTADSPLAIAELTVRLKACCLSSRFDAPSRETAFVGRVTESGFRLVPILWGQTSFLPRVLGRWSTVETGTRVEIQIVPNAALLLGLLATFACLGLLIYSRRWLDVLLIVAGCVSGAGLLLYVGVWTCAKRVRRQLLTALEGTPVSGGAPNSIRSSAAPLPTRLVWTAGVAILVGGIWLWNEIYTGRVFLTTRPIIDLTGVTWVTLGLLTLWAVFASGMSPVAQIRCLLIALGFEAVWASCVTVDGFEGDGRPLFAWRWTKTIPSFPQRPSTAEVLASDTIPVDLRSGGGDDCPGFRGAQRDGIFEHVRLEADWGRTPPRVVWQQPVGVGWSAFAIANGFAVTQEQRGDDEAVVCYEVLTGRECWAHRDRARFRELMGGDGPRATPTIHNGFVYAVGATGILNCLDGHDGHRVWSVNILADTHAPTSLFGIAGSPLIHGETVIVHPGGPEGSLVAYDLVTGRRRWAGGHAPVAYSSPQLARLGGRDQVLCFNSEGLFAHATDDGRVLWSHPWVTPPERNNVCQPIVWVDEREAETVFISSGYGQGCTLLEIRETNGEWTATPRWRNLSLKSKFSSAVLHEGYVYGLDENILVCVDLRTGHRRWKGGRYGFGQLMRVDRLLLVLTDDGELVLCDATPDAHRERCRFPVLNGRTWNHAALSGNRLLIRNDRQAACILLPKPPNEAGSPSAN